jgi:GNAT superfamily N-acetyltransferase
MGRTIDDGAMCMLYDVVVHSGHQGQGLGRRIVRRLVDEARQRGCISIGLFADEKNAEWLIPFYQSLGFVETGTGMKYQRD